MEVGETVRWLNERVGQEIFVGVVFTTPDWEHRIFADFEGAGILRDETRGWYAVGEVARFDTRDLDPPLRIRGERELVLKLAEAVALILVDRSRPDPGLYAPLWQ